MSNIMLGPPTAAAGRASKCAGGTGATQGTAGAGDEFMALIAGLLADFALGAQPQAQTLTTAPGPNDGKVPDETGADGTGISLPTSAGDVSGVLTALAAQNGPAVAGAHAPQGCGKASDIAVERSAGHGHGHGLERLAQVDGDDSIRAGGPVAVVTLTITRSDAAATTVQDAPAATAPTTDGTTPPVTTTTPATDAPAASAQPGTGGQAQQQAEDGPTGGTTPSIPVTTTDPADTAAPAQPATPATPADPAQDAQATPATPAVPATPARPDPVAATHVDEPAPSQDATPAPVAQAPAVTQPTRAADAPASTALPAHSPRQLAHELTGRLRMAVREEGKEILLQLRPPELGTLTIRVTMHDGVLQAAIAADRPEAAKLLEQSLGHLEDMLADRGFDLGSVDVDSGTAGFGSNGANAAGSDQAGRHGRHGDHHHRHDGQDDLAPVGAASVARHDGDVDLLA